MLRRVSIVAVAVAALSAGCSQSIPPPDADTPPSPAPSTMPAGYVAPPAQQVLAYVPASTQVVTVTDFSEIALQLGVELSSKLTPLQRQSFWRRAETETALLTPGMLRPDESRLLNTVGFGAEDVVWEAHLYGEDGAPTGWVLSFADDVAESALRQAIDDKIGPFAGATLDGHLVMSSGVDPTTSTGETSWADDGSFSDLIGPAANSVYLARGCVAGAADTAGIDPLEAYSVTLEGTLATARLGLDRVDLPRRVELDAAVPDFAEGFEGGVTDESTGRIGFHLVSPAAAAELTLREQLPFAACDS